ncbi:MAG: DUF4292 domain-containing protein [Bacteroidaceae bacterium]|nr:DUF4292 domain-containing protein [Bacteroidaceae bacterium]
MKKILWLFVTLIALSSCGTKRIATNATGSEAQTQAQEAVTAYVRSVQANNLTTKALTAKLSMDLGVGSKNVGVTGSLKMKKNDVIQLSLVVLFVEVARIEFSPKDVLIIDRVHKQYVRASYNEVDFLAQAGLNFYSLQALFWHELFVPAQDGSVSADRFHLSSAGDHTLLTIADAPQLNYDFLTVTKSGLIDRLSVEGKQASARGSFVWRYSDFTQIAGKPYPKKMSLSITGVGKDIRADLSLSGFSTDAGWNGHTVPSDKYRQRSASDVLKNLF